MLFEFNIYNLWISYVFYIVLPTDILWIFMLVYVDFQKAAFRVLKDGISDAKRCPFGMQTGTSWNVTCNMLIVNMIACQLLELIKYGKIVWFKSRKMQDNGLKPANKAYVFYLLLSFYISLYFLYIFYFHPPGRAVPRCSRCDYEL